MPPAPARQSLQPNLPDIGVIFLLSLLPIFWTSVLRVGFASLQPNHVGMLLILTCFALSPAHWTRFLRFYRVRWVMAYLPFLILAVLIYGYHDTSLGKVSLIRQMLVFTIALIILTSNVSPRALYIGAISGIWLTFMYMNYCAAVVGLSTFDAFVDFILTRDFKGIIVGYYRTIFNAFAIVNSDGLAFGAYNPGIEFNASMRNPISSSLVVLSIILLATRDGQRRSRFKWLLEAVTLSVASILVLTMFSRNSILIISACVLLVTVMRTLRTRSRLNFAVMAAILASFVAWVIFTDNFVKNIILLRFYEDTATVSSRLDQFDIALDIIRDNWLLGIGFQEIYGYIIIHNFFIASWTYGGFFLFLAASFFYATIAYTLFQYLKLFYNRSLYEHQFNPAFVACLPLSPLLRTLSGGDGGQLQAPEWVALGVFTSIAVRQFKVAGKTRRHQHS